MDSGYRLAAVIGAIFGAAALLVATVALVQGAGNGGSSGAAGAVEEGATPEAVPRVDTFDIEAGEFFFRPGRLDVPTNTTLTLNVTNSGGIPHDLRLVEADTGTRLLGPGESETAVFGPFNHSVELICTVPGHAAAGMRLSVNVTGAAELASTATAGTADGDGNAEVDPNATPSADWTARDAALAPAPAGTLHQLTLEATEVEIEVAPGVTQQLWTFNDQTPGPVLRGKVGDTFEVTLVNKGKLGHSIDFHASKVAWNDEMRTIQPGESLVYRFEAKHAGIYMYHCGTAPALHHIGNGMYGAIIVDPPDLPPVDGEFLFVQSEFYLGPQGQPGDLTKMQRDQWDAVVFNGYVSQYLHAPIRIEPDRRYRAWVLDVGPSENSSFHVVGTVFDTVYKEGSYLLRPDGSRGGSQALDLQPAQGGFVEFTMDEAGLYLIVTHKFSNVGKGALGVFQAGDVAATGAGGH
ncbi:MAG: multicopper oxidase domain-containing protein [Dehalococcoidia bacterium]